MKCIRFWLVIAIVAALLSISLACNKSDESVKTFQFDTVTLDANGKVINRRTLQAKSYMEALGSGVQLEMVLIPAGTFTMGSPATEKERGRDEGPQHQVSMPQFNIGKFEVTQAQWREVSSLPKVEIELNPDPSSFKGDSLPVEKVSWEEAVEFCARLSKATGRHYRLPSEAEWEYAARAGTQTPFAFGETITPEIINYNGDNPYSGAAKGTFRQKTTGVGSLGVANGFGLYDMYGNVREWCQDVWHDDYNEAPVDGSAWLSGGEQSYRVVRGGAWHIVAYGCRSADRSRGAPGFGGDDGLGFRVAASSRP
jgi:formylglycine-generating enzyme required for sulfatase activity